VQCPLLCKEFVVDAWQIFYARIKGADAILLIAAVLPDLDIKYMTKICKMLGLTALVEVWMVLLLELLHFYVTFVYTGIQCNIFFYYMLWTKFAVLYTDFCSLYFLFWPIINLMEHRQVSNQSFNFFFLSCFVFCNIQV